MSGALTREALRSDLPTAGELAFAALMTWLLLCACASLLGVATP